MKTAIIAAVALTFTACCKPVDEYTDPCIADVYGACLSLDPRLSGMDVEAQVRNAVERSAAFWGAEPSVVSGWRIHLTPEYGSWGACDYCSSTISLLVDDGNSNCPLTSLPHEIGHVVLGEEVGHDDPRFDQLKTDFRTKMHLADCFGY